MSDEARDYKKFINALRCPICKAQLDGNIHLMRSELECRGNPLEYRCYFSNKQTEPYLEVLSIYYDDFQYEMKIRPQGNHRYESIIDRYDLSFLPDKKHLSIVRLYRVPANLSELFTKRPSQKDLLKKMKMYNLFS